MVWSAVLCPQLDESVPDRIGDEPMERSRQGNALLRSVFTARDWRQVSPASGCHCANTAVGYFGLHGHNA
jgi:hypothetical protein